MPPARVVPRRKQSVLAIVVIVVVTSYTLIMLSRLVSSDGSPGEQRYLRDSRAVAVRNLTYLDSRFLQRHSGWCAPHLDLLRDVPRCACLGFADACGVGRAVLCAPSSGPHPCHVFPLGPLCPCLTDVVAERRVPSSSPGAGKTVLVTGVSSTLGWNVAREAAERGMVVVGVDPIPPASVPTGVTFIRGDVYISSFADELFATFRFAYVYHMQVCACP
jgi:hypothetical protein